MLIPNDEISEFEGLIPDDKYKEKKCLLLHGKKCENEVL